MCTKISEQQKQSYIIRYKPLQLPESPLRPRDPNINSWPAPISSRLGLLAYYQQAQSLLRGDFWPQCMGRSMTVSRLRPVLNTTEPEGLWQWEDCDEDLYMTINFWWIYTWPIKRKHSQNCITESLLPWSKFGVISKHIWKGIAQSDHSTVWMTHWHGDCRSDRATGWSGAEWWSDSLTTLNYQRSPALA